MAKTLVDLTNGEQVQGVLPLANGGTGLSMIGGNNTVLTSNGTTASWQTPSGGGGNPPQGDTHTATAAGTTTLTVTSTQVQAFTGTTTQTVTLPTTSVTAGMQWSIENQSTGAVTVNASGGATVLTLAGGTAAVFTANAAAPTTAAGWDAQYGAVQVVTGKSLTVNNTITLSATDGSSVNLNAFADNAFSIVDSADTTKALAIDCSTITTGNTRTFEAPDLSGAMHAEAIITSTATRTLTSQTAAQKIFGTPTNGQVTLPVGSFFFDCFFTLSSMSSTSGSFGFALAGTATIAGQLWQTEGNKAALATAAAAQNTMNTAANTAIVTATTATTGWAHVWGKVRVSAAGTLIPQVSLGVAAAAVVGADSFFRIWSIGPSTMTSVGPWS